MLLTEFRQQYPQYDDMDDATLTGALHKKYYSDIDFGEFSQSVGYEPTQSNAANKIVSALTGVNDEVINSVANRNKSVVDYAQPPGPETMTIMGNEITTSEQFPTLNQNGNVLRDLTEPGWRVNQFEESVDEMSPGKRKPSGMYSEPEPSPMRAMIENIFGEVTPEQNAVDMVKAAAMKGGQEEGISAKQYLEETGPKTGVLKRAGKDVLSGAVSTADGMLGYVSRMTDSPDARTLQTVMSEKARDLMPADPTFLDEVASGFGSAGTFFIPGVGIMKGTQALSKISPRMAAWLGSGSSAGLEAATEAGAVYTELRDKGLSHQEATEKADNTFWANAALVSVTNKLGLFNESGSQLKRRSLAAVSEGILQEAPQQIISNVNTDKDWKEGVAKSAAIGSIVGGTLAGNTSSQQEQSINNAETDKPVSSVESPLAKQIAEKLQASVQQPQPQSQYSNNNMVSDVVELMKQKNKTREETPNGVNVSNGVSGEANPVKPAEVAVVRQNTEGLEQEKQAKTSKLPELMQLQSELQQNGYKNTEELNSKLSEIKVLADMLAYGEEAGNRDVYNEATQVKKWAVEFGHNANKEKVEDIEFEQHLKDTNRHAKQWNNLPDHVQKDWAVEAGLTKAQVKQVVSSKWGPIEEGEAKAKLETMLDEKRDHHESLRNEKNQDDSGASPVAESQALDTSEPSDTGVASSRESAAPDTRIEDLGEKIGGARKDTSTKLGGRSKVASEKVAGWRKRYIAMENVMADADSDQGSWVLFDTRKNKSLRGANYQSMSFKTQEEAEKMLPILAVAQNHSVMRAGKDKLSIWRRVGDRKRVRVTAEEFDSNEDAMKYMADHAEELIESKLNFGEEVLPTPEKVYREGESRREGKIKGEDFMEIFGFRGVEFGNWNNQDDRQEVMNHAYDALLDMAEIIGVPPKALSLNGDLALAFGARGQGLSGAKAHYEPAHSVINLTKMSGAGSLAHEWLHSLDHYFGRIDGKAAAEMIENDKGNKVFDIKSDKRTFASHGFLYNSKARPEVQEAYSNLITTMFRKAEKYVEDTAQADKFLSSARDDLARRIKNIADELAEQKDPKYWKRNNKPATAEQLTRFNELGDSLINGESVDTELRLNDSARTTYQIYRDSNDVLDEMAAIYKKVRGRAGFKSKKDGVMDRISATVTTYKSRIQTLEEAKDSTQKTKRVPTSFLMQARAADQARSGDYWSTPHEMAARAFASYVEDRLADKKAKNDFLAYHAHGAVLVPIYPEGLFRPYPEGKERVAVNEAFDKFFDVLQTKETEKGIALFSKEKSENPATLKTNTLKNKVNELIFEGDQLAELSELNQDKVNGQQRKQEDIGRIIARFRAGHLRARPAGRGLAGTGNAGRSRAYDENSGSGIREKAKGKDLFLEQGLEAPAFKRYIDGAFFVSEEGKPVVWLHGSTNKNKIQFSKERLGQSSAGAPSGLGFYSTQDQDTALGYATDKESREVVGAIYHVVSNVKNPYIIEKGADLETEYELNAYIETREALQAAGYDGVYVKGLQQLVAFESNGFKSLKSEDAKTGEILRIANGLFDPGNEQTFYSKEKAASSGLSVSEVEKIIAPVILKWGDKAPKVDVVQNISEIPEHIIDADEHGAENISAIHYGSEEQIYLVADKLNDEEHILSRLAHEAVGHHSFEQIMGDDLEQVLERVQWLKRSGDKKLTAISDEVFERYGRLDKITEAKEIVALVAEKGVSSPLLTKVVAAVRKFLRNLGINLKWSKTDLDALVIAAAKNLETNRNKKEKAEYKEKSKFYSKEENERYFARDEKEILDDIDDEASSVPAYDEIKRKLSNSLDHLRPGALKMLTRRHLADIGSSVLPTIKTYVLTAEKMDAFRNTLVAESSEIAKNWTKWASEKQNTKAADSMVDIMHAATIAGVDPAEPYKSIIDLAEAKEDINKQFRFAKSMPGEAGKYIEKVNEIKKRIAFERNREKAYPELKRQWDKLPPEAQDIYREVRDHYVERLNETEKALMDKIDRAELSAKEKEQYKNEMRLQFESVRIEGPYFPLARFGDYWAKVLIPTEWQKKYSIKDKGFTSKESQHGKWAVTLNQSKSAIETFESKEDAIKWAVDKSMDYEFYMFEKKGHRDNLVAKKEREGLKVKTGHKIDKGSREEVISDGFIADVLKVVDKLNLTSNSTHDEIYQLFLNTLPDVSMRKSFIHRQKKEGFTSDALRAFANHNFHGAYQLSKLKFADIMQTQIENMEEQARDMSGDKADKAAQILNETKKRHDWAMNPMGAGWANNVTQFNFVWYLGATPAAAIVNMTQTAMVSFPAMGAKFGFTKAGKELLNASRDFMSHRVEVKDGVFSIEGALKGDELRAYHELVDTGIIDKTLAHDLAAMSETASTIYSPTKDKVMTVVSYAFHHAERFNREVTSIATYRLARSKNMSHKQAVQEAYDMVDATHFNYSNANKAAFMQHDVAKVAFIFKQYSLNMIYLLARSTYQSVKGESAAVKSEARKKLGGILFMSYLFVGYDGMPWLPFGLIDLILEMIWDDEDEPYDIEAERRNFLSENLGSTWADVLSIGPVEALTGVGVSDRLALDNLWFRESGRDLEAKEELQYQALSMLGPTFGILDGAARGVGLVKEGKVYRGIETMLPKFAKDGMKAIRIADEGATTLKGDPIVDDINAFEAFMQFIGFSVGRVNKQYDARSAIKNAEHRIKDRRKLLMNKFATSIHNGDTTWQKDILNEIRFYNKKNPTNAITVDSIKRSLKMRAKTSAMTKNGVYLNKNMQHLRNKGRFADDE